MPVLVLGCRKCRAMPKSVTLSVSLSPVVIMLGGFDVSGATACAPVRVAQGIGDPRGDRQTTGRDRPAGCRPWCRRQVPPPSSASMANVAEIVLSPGVVDGEMLGATGRPGGLSLAEEALLARRPSSFGLELLPTRAMVLIATCGPILGSLPR